MHARKNFKYLSLIIIAFLVVPLTVLTLSGCGASAASANKKQKSKKASAKRANIDEDEDAESSESETQNEASQDKKKVAAEDKAENKAEKPIGETSKTKEKPASEKPAAALGEATWADLIKGNERFRAGKHTNGQFITARRELVKDEHPQTIVLGCADSRVPPEMIFDKNLGDLFVVRAAGNIAGSIELGSIEYAVEHLHATTLVILGHENCGAVAAALSGEEMSSKNLEAIVEKITPAFDGSKSCPLKSQINLSCVELNVRQSAKDILLESPIIKEAIENNQLTIIQAVYHLESGEVVRLS